MREKAESLTNGHKGDVFYLCEVVADMASVLADVAENGCAQRCSHRFSWPACAAVLGATAMLLGFAWQILS
jgi:hypothetical protein